MIPNVYVEDDERDLVRIDNRDRWTEFEIKTTLADLKNEWKHKAIKHNRIRFLHGVTPNLFYFVIPRSIASRIELHNEYGIISYTERGKLRVEKEARYLHRVPLTFVQKHKILKSIYYKYWKTRINDQIFSNRKNSKRKSRL